MLTVSTQLAPGDDLQIFAKLLGSLTFADELLIFNMQRVDKPALALFAQHGARVINVPIPPVVEYIRKDQILKAKSPWVLILDYDEIIPPKLGRELKKITQTSTPQSAAYYLTRRNYSLGFPLRHGGFGGDVVPRLFHRDSFISWPKQIHSLPSVKGQFGYCQGYMEHHKDQSLAQMVTKTNRYSAVEAKQFYLGKLPPVTPYIIFRKTLMEFLRRYLFKAGFLDGRIGIIQALYQSYSVFLSYAKLYELQLAKGK